MINKGQSDGITQMAISVFDRVRDIKRRKPNIAKKIDFYEKGVRRHLEAMRLELRKLKKDERNLVTIMIINGLHRMSEEVLLD